MECRNKVNGNCTLHNVQCWYPQCEESKEVPENKLGTNLTQIDIEIEKREKELIELKNVKRILKE